MTIQLVSTATYKVTDSATGSTITIGSCSSGHDIYVLATSRGHNSTDAYATCTDNDSGGNTYTLKGTDTDRRAYLWWKKATSATSGKVITIAGAKTATAAGIGVFSGSASGDPTTNLTFQTNTSGTETHAGFTPANANSMICVGVYNLTNDTIPVTNMAGANLGSMEPEVFDHFSTANSDCYLIFFAKESQGGPTATGNFTWQQDDSGTRSVAFAIKPAIAASTSTAQSPQHTYGAAGTYVVTLTVTDNDGLSSATTSPVTVS